MEHTAENSRENMRRIVTRESFDPEIIKKYPFLERIFNRMADLKIDLSNIPTEMMRRMSVKETDEGLHFDFTKSSRSGIMMADLVKSPEFLYKVAFLLKTDPSVLYTGEGFSELKTDDHFVPMDPDRYKEIKELMGTDKIGKRLRKYRREKEITIAEVAEYFKLAAGTWRNYESDKNDTLKLTTEQLFLFSKKCGISPDLIMLGDTFNSVIEGTDGNTEPERIELGPEVKIVYNTGNRLHRAYFKKRARQASVEEILQCRQWIIDNIGKVEPDVMFIIEGIINRAMHKTPVMGQDNDEDDE